MNNKDQSIEIQHPVIDNNGEDDLTIFSEEGIHKSAERLYDDNDKCIITNSKSDTKGFDNGDV